MHMQPSIRRGVAFAEDVRFCFTVFEDNEQHEPGDTVEHTWWKESWPVCTTKWLYIWGSRSGEVCVSTTAPFSYHNDGQSPLPPPRVLRTFESIEPNRMVHGSNLNWVNIDCSKLVDEDAVAVLLHGRWYSGSGFIRTGVRKPGASGAFQGSSIGGNQFWMIAGLDAAKRFQVYCQAGATHQYYVMGYFNNRVTMLDTGYNRVPYASGWSTVDYSDVLPDNAIAGIFGVGARNSRQEDYGVRAYGSTDNITAGSSFHHAVVKLNDKKIQYWKSQTSNQANYMCELIGYFTAGIYMTDNGSNIDPVSTGSWQMKPVTSPSDYPLLAILHMYDPAVYDAMGTRKRYGDHAWTNNGCGHVWPMPHVHNGTTIEIYRKDADQHYLLQGVIY